MLCLAKTTRKFGTVSTWMRKSVRRIRQVATAQDHSHSTKCSVLNIIERGNKRLVRIGLGEEAIPVSNSQKDIQHSNKPSSQRAPPYRYATSHPCYVFWLLLTYYSQATNLFSVQGVRESLGMRGHADDEKPDAKLCAICVSDSPALNRHIQKQRPGFK